MLRRAGPDARAPSCDCGDVLSLIASPAHSVHGRAAARIVALRQFALRAPCERPRSRGAHARAAPWACTPRNDGACACAPARRTSRTRLDWPGALRRLACAMLRVAYGRGCEALRGVASSGDRSGRVRCGVAPAIIARGARPCALSTSDSRKACARRAAIGRRHSRQCGSVSASSCVSGAAIRHTPFGSSPKSRAVNSRSSRRSSRNASTSASHRLHGIKCERIAVTLIGMQHAQRRVAARARAVRGALRTRSRRRDSFAWH